MPSEQTPPEFAQQYTKAEAIRIVVIGTLLGALAIILGKAWVFPAMRDFANTAHCRTVFGIDGVTILWYALFVGLPLQATVLFMAAVGWRGYRILRDGQFPPRREKVGRPTRIRRGKSARLIGYLHLIACLPPAAMTAWGYFQAEKLIRQPTVVIPTPLCAGNGEPDRPSKGQ